MVGTRKGRRTPRLTLFAVLLLGIATSIIGRGRPSDEGDEAERAASLDVDQTAPAPPEPYAGTVSPVGHSARRRKPRLAVLAVLALAVGAFALLPMTAGAVHDLDLFELDGNVADESGGGDDWETLFPNGEPSTSGSAIARLFVTDLTGDEDDAFGSGLTKDTVDVSQWTWVETSVSPEKDDILHAYAASYLWDDPNSDNVDQILYFGQDRAPKPQGATSMGFWFFQGTVGLDSDGTFSGTHVDGDILITADMTQGGDISVINIFEWEGGADGELVLQESIANADCGTVADGDIACAIANQDEEIAASWYDGLIPENIFFEGGINLDVLFEGDNVPCFSSFLANTRTSPSETADLKDFVLGNINTCGGITIRKDADPDPNDPSITFGFTATNTTPASFSLADGGSQSFTQLEPGTYTFDEGILPSGWTFDDINCTTVSGTGTSVSENGSQLTVTLGRAGQVDCTYVNKRQQGKIELQKDFQGTPESVTLKIGTTAGGSEVDSQVLTDDGTTGENTVNTGTYYVSETLTNPGNYNTSLSCFVDANGDSAKQEGEAARSVGGDGSVVVGHNEDVVCVFVNTRKQGKIELQKDFQGTPESVTLKIGTSAGGDQVDSAALSGDGSTGENPVDTGTYYVSETLATPANYNTSLSCFVDANGDSVKQEGEAARSVGGDGAVVVGHDEDVVCVFVNARKQGKIELKKDWVGTAGSVTLEVKSGSTVVASGTANGADGSTGETPVDTGNYTLHETFTSGTQADYTSTLTCVDEAAGHDNTGLPNGAAFAAGDTPVVAVDEGDDIVCTITNTRKQGKIELQKDFQGTPESVTLKIGTSAGGDQVDSAALSGDGSTGENPVDTGTYYVSETLATPANYNTSLSCFVDANGDSVKQEGEAARSVGGDGAVVVGHDEDVVCVFVNTRKTGTIQIVKDFVGAATTVDLKLDGETKKTVTADDSTDVMTVDTGDYTVSEAFPLENGHLYDSTFACTNEGAPIAGKSGAGLSVGVTVNEGDAIVCTFTNTRKPSSILVTKTPSPASLPEPGGPVTYTVTVENTSDSDDVTITLASFTDSVEGGPKLAIDDIDCNGATAGNGLPRTLEVGETMTCTFVKTVTGDAGDQIDDVVEVTGKDEAGQDVKDDDDATVTLTDVVPTITVVKTAAPVSLPEPGGVFTYTVEVTNNSTFETLTLVSLVDDTFGDLLDDAGNAAISESTCVDNTPIAPGATYSCSFKASVTGNAGLSHTNTVTGAATDDDGNEVTDDDDATVTLTDVPSSIVVDKTANPTSVQEPGANVTFTVVVRNTSVTDSVTLTAAGFTDKVGSGPVEAIANIDCNGAAAGSGLPLVLARNDGAAGGPDEVSCTFVKAVTGSGGTSVTDVVEVTGTDDDGNPVKDDDDETVTITSAPQPPPPPPPAAPAPVIDLAVTKVDNPDPATLNGQITYVMVVTNNGPSTATNVRLADPLPAGSSFVSVTTNQGTCTGGAMISCSLGTLFAGQQVNVTVIVTATRAGTVFNEVTVVGNEPESNTANNRAEATTLVPAPLVPPKPQPKPKPVVCYTFTVSSKTLTVGKKSRITVKVALGKKVVRNARVVVRGAGILKTGRTNARGVAVITITARRPGIVTVTVPQKIVCGTKRIGVVGAFEPPVTG